MRAAAVVVRWRGGDEVRRCLQSLLEHGGGILRRIVLVDSGSGDGGAAPLARKLPAIELVELPENWSFAWAVARGVERCTEPLLFLLNPDAELLPGAVDELAALLAERPSAAGAVPLLRHADGRTQHRWQLRSLPGPWRLAFGVAGAPAFPAGAPTSAAPVQQPAAAAWLIRREVWDALDGLDPDFAPAWWEDVDFCARLDARLGRPDFPAREGFWVVPTARVVHHGGSSVARMSDADFLKAFYLNLLRYAERHHPGHLALIHTGLRLSLLGRGLVRPGRRTAYLRVLQAIRGLS